MPLSVGNDMPSTLFGGASDKPKSKDELRDTISRLERQRGEYKRQNEENSDAVTDNRIKNLENRINNLRSRMDKMKSADDGKCQTCENRRYQDGSNDPGVSFKSASKISGNAEAAVRGHEQEHVSRNRAKAEREGKEIVYQSVVIKHAICPECGKNYVAGGETTTVTRTKPENENEPLTGKSSPENGAVSDISDKKTENSEFADHKDANDPDNRAPKQDERFNVGMYDREREIGRFLNIVA